MNDNPEVIRHGIFDTQVCVPKDYTDEQVVDFTNMANSSGTSGGWHIRRAGDPRYTNNDPERVQCSERKGCVHLVLDC